MSLMKTLYKRKCFEVELDENIHLDGTIQELESMIKNEKDVQEVIDYFLKVSIDEDIVLAVYDND